MKSIFKILLAGIIVTVFGCTDNWDNHYKMQPETININVWDAIKGKSELSSFVTLMEKYKYDTLFTYDNAYTIFVPDNDAMAKLALTQLSDTTILNYHISKHFIQPIDIKGKRKLQTLGSKFSTYEEVNGKPTYDGIILTYESPLYKNGKFFVMGDVATPRYNLYEYFGVTNHYLKSYVDSKDSVILNKLLSRAIGFDAKGNTIYDSVSTKYNSFEDLSSLQGYFPVSTELRAWSATFVFPRLETYEGGLTAMAQKLGGSYTDFHSIPIAWQQQILIPYLLKQGTFLNMLEIPEFKDKSVLSYKKKFTMMNIRGDSIIVDYKPTAPYLCSNGLFYDYTNFVVPDKLYNDTIKMEGEWLVRNASSTKFVWRDSVKVTSTKTFDPIKEYVKGTSKVSAQNNDSILTVKFPKGYKDVFTLEFKSTNMFPRAKYRMEVLTKMDVGGIYDIYINNVLVKHFDYYVEFTRQKGLIRSVAGPYFSPKGQFQKFDCYVTNIATYGKPTIRFEYKGPGNVANNGLVLDALYFLPVAN